MDPLGKSMNANKHLKEEFVSNLTGSSLIEIIALSLIVPTLFLLRRSVCLFGGTDPGYMNASLKKNEDVSVSPMNWRTYMGKMALDFLFVVLPVLLNFTILSDWTCIWAMVLASILLLYIAYRRFGSPSSPCLDGGPYSLKTSISNYRVSMMIVTCLCILAVDFRIFPRRYAKTETYGTSLMDLGVGSFVLVNSLVSRQARNLSSNSKKWRTALQSTSPLIFLGFGRLVSTIGIDYQVHVGEYGVHWNFFFTLAAVSILTSVIDVAPKYCGILGLSILIGYQICLLCGLNLYLISSERGMDIISQNKEGVYSIFGYWGMYLVGVQLGNYLFFGKHSIATVSSNQWARNRVWILSLLFWLLTVILDRYVERVSRRMCNLAYVALVLAQNFQVLAILMLSDYFPGRKATVLEAAFNCNLLGSFLLANLLTGLVNLTVDTLFASSLTSFAILVAYAFILSFITACADFAGVRLKFW